MIKEPFDWEAFRFNKPVQCKVNIRPLWNGMPPRPGVAEALNGKTLMLNVLWQYEDDETYPGEWALAPSLREPDPAFVQAGIGWLASGDVEPLEGQTP